MEVDSVVTLTSDGLSVPGRFTLAGGDYLFSWVINRPTDERGCVFDALLTSEPTVSPLTLRSLGPLTVVPEGRLSGQQADRRPRRWRLHAEAERGLSVDRHRHPALRSVRRGVLPDFRRCQEPTQPPDLG